MGYAQPIDMYEIFNRLKSNPNLFTKIIVASFFVNLLALATPIYVIQVLQRYVAYGVTSTLITLVVGIIFVTVFEFFFRNIRHRMTRETESVNVSLSDKVIKKIVSIKSSFYLLQKNFRPDIVTKNLNTVQNTFNATTTLTLIDVPFVLIFLIALYLIHYQLGIIASLFIFTPFIILNFYRNKINKLSENSNQLALGTARLHDNSSSRFETIKYFNLINAVKKSWTTLLSKWIEVSENLDANKNVFTSFMSASATLLTIIIIAWGAVLAVNGEISVGALIGANILAGRAISPIIRLVQSLEPIHRSTIAVRELNRFLSLPEDSQQGSEIKEFEGKLIVKDLQFQYPDTKIPLFENLNFTVQQGELAVVTGSNGSGKSTLIKNLIRLLEFNRGQIFYDSIELNQLSLTWVRKNLTYMPQEPKFVDGLLLDNLIGLSEIKKEKMEKILDSADLLDFVNSDPKGIHMPLNNRGEDLPFGIRKRMALARALAISGQIVALDEPTESIDERGKKAIYKLIGNLIKNNKTLIISSQDEEIIAKANLKIDLDKKPVPLVTEIRKNEIT
jgi:ATP-binding cassette subfamily C protein LapB